MTMKTILLTDSRSLSDPAVSLFFALSTHQNDGHKYVRNLYEKGVRNFVVQHPFTGMNEMPDANLFWVSDTLAALQQLTAFHRKKFNIPVIGITGNFDVKVLGTEFNVKAYGSDEIHTVNVKNGKVQVEMSEATIRLVADERFEINSLSGEYGKSKAKRQSDIWQERYLSFDKTPIRDVANELERLYNCRIIFKEGQSFDNLISGEHYNRDLESVLKSIRYASEIKYKYDKENNEIIFYK
ncbi:hypothetical protein FACS189446_8930 [Bacteroidia bacterium]|nr:hypothetical protein FACS189446_8930 [Bacteroidia bacterium]